MKTVCCHKYKYICILILLLSCFGAKANPVLKQISNINGLSNNSVNCILEDSTNTLWIGTWDGMNAYDGNSMITYRYNRDDKNSICNNIVRQIIEQDSSTLWIATDWGINRLNKQSGKFDTFYLGTKNKTPSQENAYIIRQDAEKNIYCYVMNIGIFIFNPQLDEFDKINIGYIEYIKDFVIDDFNTIHILFKDKTVGYAKANSLKETYYARDLAYHTVSNVQKIYYSDKCILALTTDNITLIDASSYSQINVDFKQSKNISHLLLDRNTLYITQYQGGLSSYDLMTRTLSRSTQTGLNTSLFYAYKGSQNILWLGSDGQGIFQLYDYEAPFTNISTKYAVRAFCELDNSNILIGTKGGGIERFNIENKTLHSFADTNAGLQSNAIFAITKNKTDDIFIGGDGAGINILYKNDINRVTKLQYSTELPYFQSVYALCFTNNDSVLWIGTAGYGLIKANLNRERGRYVVESAKQFVSSNTRSSLQNNVIYALSSDSENRLWIGTRGAGVYIMNIKDETIKSIGELEGGSALSNNDVLSTYWDGTTIWFGTSYGLNKVKLDADIAISHFTDKNGLRNNTIHGILKDRNSNIWVSTNGGLSKISKTNVIVNYTVSDGLQSDEFSDGSFMKSTAGMLFFGGVNGFNYFHPEKIKFREYVPPLILNSIKIYNTDQPIYKRINNNTLRLSDDERYVSLAFISKDFINNSNCEYAYRITNESEEWILLDNSPKINFSKLTSGKHYLEVKSTNGDKVWNSEVYKLEIVVDFPWWLSFSAILTYCFILVGLTLLARTIIRNRIRLSRRLYAERVERQHQQKAHEAKLDFFTNIAHEFFTPLTLIYSPAQFLLESAKLDDNTRRYLRVMKNNAERMQKLISELMEFRKTKSGHTPLYPEDIDITLLVDYISDNYTDILHENKINYTVNKKNLSVLYTDRDALEKIFINLVSNAFKYTPRGGTIAIDVFQDDEASHTLHFNIKNSGKGLTAQQMLEIFDKYMIYESPKVKNQISTGIGLNLTKSLTEILGGEIAVDSQMGEYVEFKVSIPKLQKGNINIRQEDETRENVTISNLKEKDSEKLEDITILVVEDEKNIRDLLKDILSTKYKVVATDDGKEALDSISKNHPQLIITDIMMPNIDGLKLIKTLKENLNTTYIPIISISAKISIEDHIQAYQYGADMYITKPFHHRYLLSTIDNLLNKQRSLKEYFNSSLSSYSVMDGIQMHKEEELLLKDVFKFIINNIDDESLNPDSLANFLGVSKASLYRNLKDITDKTPSELIRTIRIEEATKLLSTTQLTVSEIIYKCGFSNRSYFYREFAKIHGLSPTEYRGTTKLK